MPFFYYKAHNDEGIIISGDMEVDSPDVIAFELEKKGYIPIVIKEKKGLGFFKINLLLSRISTEDLIFFTRQLRTLIKSGIPLLPGLRAIEEQTENPKLKKILSTVCNDIDQGRSLSESLSRHNKVFSKVYTNLVYTGEVSGNLQDILERLILILDFNRKTTSNLKAAMRYPIMVIIMLLVAFGFLVTFVIPTFVTIFQQAGVPLPLPTRVMIGIHTIVTQYGTFVIGGLILLGALFFYYIQTHSGKINWDYSKMKIPVLGTIFQKIYMSRFTFALEALTKSGVPIVNSLEIVAQTLGNEYIAIKIKEIAEKVKLGKRFTATIRESKIFPPLILRMISTGEEAGSLDEMLREITEFYVQEIDYTISRLSAYIEPFLIVALGGMVLFFALAIFLPWWDLIKVFRGYM